MLKRRIALVMLAAMLIFITACSSNTNSPVGEKPVSKAVETKENIQVQKGNVSAPETLKELKLDKALKKKFNIFFSNFTEAVVPDFQKDKLSNSNLILFGIRHNIINNPDFEEAYGRISAKYVEASVQKYFGKSIEKHETVKAYELTNDRTKDIGYFTYKDGYYFIPGNKGYQIDPARVPQGETWEFSQISKLVENKDGYFTAYIDVYEMYPDQFFSDPYTTTLSDWKRENPDFVPKLVRKMKATIKKEADGRYILIDYLKTK